MSINFNGPILISKWWTDFKSLVIIEKALSVQYDINTDTDKQNYVIFAMDNYITYICNIWLGTVPDDVQIYYSQSQNDIDRSDFESNYLSNSNIRLSPRIDSTQTLYDLTDSSVIYIGLAHIGDITSDPVWFIKKITLDVNGNPTSTTHTSYTAVWDNRTSEMYQ